MNNFSQVNKSLARIARNRVSSRRHVPEGGYARGSETRLRIIETALEAFGDSGLEQASTRLIASRAGVNQGALTYYFGNKEGLYRACAEHIAAFAETHARPMLSGIETVLAESPAREELLGLLRRIADGAFDLMGGEKRPNWILFLVREFASPSVAAEIIYERATRPTVMVLARLIGQLTERSADDPRSIMRAVTFITHLTNLRQSRRFALHALGWPDFNEGRGDDFKALLWRQVEALITSED